MGCSKDGGNFLLGSGSRKLLFNSSTPTAQAGQLHFISKDIPLEQIVKVQSFAPELLADRQTRRAAHASAGGSQLSCISWGAGPVSGIHEVCRAFARNRGLMPAGALVLGLMGQALTPKSRTRLEPWSQHNLLMGTLHPAGVPPALPVNKPCSLSAHTVTACFDNVLLLDLFDFAGSGMSIGLPGPPGPPGTPGISYSDLTAYLRSKQTSLVPCHRSLHTPRIFFYRHSHRISPLPITTNNLL